MLRSIFFCCHLGENISSLWHFLRLPWHLLVIRKWREMWGRGTSMESSSQCQYANCCSENWNSKNGHKQQTSRKHPAARTAGILFLLKHKHFSGVRVCRGRVKPFILKGIFWAQWNEGRPILRANSLSQLLRRKSFRVPHCVWNSWREQDSPCKQNINKRTTAKGQ